MIKFLVVMIILAVLLYFVIRLAVKHGVYEALTDHYNDLVIMQKEEERRNELQNSDASR